MGFTVVLFCVKAQRIKIIITNNFFPRNIKLNIVASFLRVAIIIKNPSGSVPQGFTSVQ